LVLGNGSNDVLELAARAFLAPGLSAVFSMHAFAVYPLATQAAGGRCIEVPAKNFGHDLDAMLAAINANTRLVFIANPNNPTGTYSSRDEIARLHAGLRPDILLVIDQAYAEYLDADAQDGAFELAQTAPNVVITRTFSKIYGLGAERIGWGYGSAEAVAAMHRIRAPFNITTAGQDAAIAAIGDLAWEAASRAHNREWLGWLTREVAAMGNHGLRAVPSHANFLLVLFEGALTAERAYKGLMDKGFIVRWLPGQGLPHGLRITVGTPDETQGLARALRELCEAPGALGETGA